MPVQQTVWTLAFLTTSDDVCRQRADLLLSNMLFWEDVADYGAAEARFSDRLLRMNQAWSIFNKYLAVGSKNSIGGPISQSANLLILLLLFFICDLPCVPVKNRSIVLTR